VVASVLALLWSGVGSAQAMSLTENPFLQQGEKLTSPEVKELAEQGYSVALSANGDVALVGSPAYKESGSEEFAGAAWVYVRSGSTWTFQQKLVGTEGSGDAQQGHSVALSANGTTAIVGGPEDEGEHEDYYGAAWVFEYNGSKWEQVGKKLVAGGPSATTKAKQGSSVALSANGETALVGADTNGAEIGGAFVWVYEDGKWKQQGEALVGKPESRGGLQGWSVALSGDGSTALIGGPKTEGEKGENEAGAVWVSTRSGSSWSKPARVPAGSGVAADTGWGESVALSTNADTALIGGIGYDEDFGAAWVFIRSGETWTQQGEPLRGNDATKPALEGESVSLSEDGDTALIGGPDDDVDRGAAWVFVRSGSSWSEQEKLEGSGGEALAEQGFGVALSGDGRTALVGGTADGGGKGAAWVFARAPEHETETEHKGPSSTGNEQSSSSGSQTAVGPYPAPSVPAPGVAATPQAIEELLLGCSKRALVLNDVLIRDGRVALEGSAKKSLVGKKVRIVFDGGKQVATARVQPDGEFTTTAPLPPASLRESNSARYMAESGGERSLDLKLTRRLSLEPPAAHGTTVTLVGQVVPPLTKPIAQIAVEQELECGKTTIVTRVTPSRSGRFRVTVTVPAAAKAGLYRLSSSVRENTHSSKGFATYSLPLPVVLG
jgi:hypothetical protein